MTPRVVEVQVLSGALVVRRSPHEGPPSWGLCRSGPLGAPRRRDSNRDRAGQPLPHPGLRALPPAGSFQPRMDPARTARWRCVPNQRVVVRGQVTPPALDTCSERVAATLDLSGMNSDAYGANVCKHLVDDATYRPELSGLSRVELHQNAKSTRRTPQCKPEDRPP